MSYTYQEILDRMTETYTAEAGFVPEQAGDIAIRLRLLAGEIYALSCQTDWIRQQMFPQTATGEQLELHAIQRGLQRHKGRKASGIIVFSLEMPLEYDFTIPAGTICTVSDGTLRYVTKEAGIIYQGSTFAWIEAEAENSGEQYNIGAGQINTIITYFSAGLRISNATDFWGGTEDESDEGLRQRIAESYRKTPDGVNASFYEELAKSVEGVYSANAFTDNNQPGWVIVCLGGQGETPTQQVRDEVRALMERKAPMGIRVLTENAGTEPVDVSVSVTIRSDCVFSSVKGAVEAAVRRFFAQIEVGESFRCAALGKVLLEVDGVENYTFNNTSDHAVNQSTILVLGTLTVTEAT